MVPLAGLEPACLAAFDFESNASTNFATGAAKTGAVADGGGGINRHVANQLAGVRRR